MTTADILHNRLHYASHAGNDMDQMRKRADAADAVIWYVSTARASAEWLRSAMKANPVKWMDFIGPGSVQEQVERATAYLRRYCRLPKD